MCDVPSWSSSHTSTGKNSLFPITHEGSLTFSLDIVSSASSQCLAVPLFPSSPTSPIDFTIVGGCGGECRRGGTDDAVDVDDEGDDGNDDDAEIDDTDDNEDDVNVVTIEPILQSFIFLAVVGEVISLNIALRLDDALN